MKYTKICNYCSVEFQSEYHSTKSCSDECRRKFRLEYKRKLDEKNSINRNIIINQIFNIK